MNWTASVGRTRPVSAQTSSAWWLTVPALGTLLLASSRVANPSMSGVEAVTYWAAGRPLASLAHVLRHVDVVHGTYYLGVHTLFVTFGPSALLMRVPSLVGGVAAVVLVGLLARTLTGSSWAGIVAASALALSPIFEGYVVLARSYALVTAMVLLATYVLLRCVRVGGAARWWWAYTVVVTGALYLHEFTVFALLAHAVTVVWARVGMRNNMRFVVHGGLAVVAAIPLVVLSAAQSAQVGYLGRPSLRTAWTLALNFFGPAPAVVGVGAALSVIAMFGLRVRGAGVTLPRLAIPLLVVPATVLLAESVVGRPLYAGLRYVLYSLPMAALLIAGGVHVVVDAASRRVRAVPTRVRTLTSASACVLVVAGLAAGQAGGLSVSRSAAAQTQNLLAAADVLHRNARAGDAVVYVPRTLYAIDLSYPGKVQNLVDVELRKSNVQSGTLYGVRRYGLDYRRALVRLPRVWLVERPGTAQDVLTEKILETRGYVRSTRHRVRGISVTLFTHDSRRSANKVGRG